MKIGLNHTSIVSVTEANTALTIGSGDMDIFATPAMAALMENAAMKAVAESLPEGNTTVGAKLDINHLKPSALGETISATALLTEVDGKKLTFTLKAENSHGLIIGEGIHIRYIVEKEKFLSKL